MRDLFFIAFLAALFGLGLKRPFLFVLGYVYIDIVSPQRFSYYLLASVPISLIFFAAAVIGWAATDQKREAVLGPRQFLILMLLVWAGWTTAGADFPIEAAEKWSWVWKSLVFAMFLPLTLRTRLRIEALLTFMILSAGSIIITGGLKTLASGGGYGVLNLGVDNNSGLYEGSIISTLAIAIIPLIVFVMKHGTIFPRHWTTNLFCCALIFACLLIPVGTEARTGLVCLGVLVGITILRGQRKLLYSALLGITAMAAIPFLPQSFTQRMDTIESYQADESASTRLAVWRWTWDYVKDHPFGGGFDAYRGNKLTYRTTTVEKVGGETRVTSAPTVDEARAYHSAYFEMLGEQGWPGALMWLSLHVIGLWRMEVIRRRHRKDTGREAWIGELAGAIQVSHIIYMVGAAFLGIAFQSFVYMWMGVEMALDALSGRLRREASRTPMLPRPQPGFASPLPG